jgi:exodeoxyribonuclease V alpha subunit
LTRLCKFIEEYNSVSILFLTPTGKACHRLTKGFKDKGINKSAYTIHKYNYYDDDNELKKEIDDFDLIKKNEYCIIVIDEMSMVSLNVFHTFIKKINNLHNCVLLLLGDYNQLPSIDFGDVLNNLVLSQAFNTVKLINIFRSDSKSLLTVQNNILNNIPLDNIDVNDGSFVWIKENPSNIVCIKNVLNDFEELPLIITSTNKVVNEYQNIIKDKYNIDHINKDFIKFNNIIFHVDDKIMIKKNNYEKNLMNGMIGKIISISISIDNNIKYYGLNILFDGEDKPRDTFSLNELEDFELAYIITIHKSQGSEADYVIILLDEAPMLNTINLIYTAITRSKKKCILISQEKTVKSIKKITKRISNLKDFC